jgi:FixJ family two-component response regulator
MNLDSFWEEMRERGFDQPIIFFTGHGTEQLKKEVRELGATDLLMKPNFLMLEFAIKRHMANSNC